MVEFNLAFSPECNLFSIQEYNRARTTSIVMRIIRSILYILKRKSRSHKLYFPTVFLMVEMMLLGVFVWNIFSFHGSDNVGYVTNEPHYFITLIHPIEHVAPYETDLSHLPIIHKNKDIHPVHHTMQTLSIIISIIGIVIASLWIRRFFRENRLNIQWWIWPSGCWSAHAIFFSLSVSI